MFVNGSGSGSGSVYETETETKTKTETESGTTTNTVSKLFNIEIPNEIIKTDYELQELITILTNSNINVVDVILHKRFEAKLAEHEDIVFKTKMRLLYVIIANNIYRSVFEEKKLYKSNRTKYIVGVFRYNDYIIRIDDSPYCFLDEEQVVSTIHKYKAWDEPYIVIPYFTYINMKKKANGDICDCDHDPCGCSYVGDGNDGNDDCVEDDCDGNTNGPGDYSRVFYNRLRYNTISFSIQPYIKHSESLHTWAKDNITDNVNVNFSKTKFEFITHLFYKCALLLQKIHSIGLVHGDIKPDNILIKEETDFNINDPVKSRHFSVYLIDFGLSGKDNIGIGTGGTVPYCHPEFRNIRDTKRTDKYYWSVVKKKHDVWSLGLAFITLYVHRAFYSYYYKYPSYFFNSSGYVSALVLDSIGSQQMSGLFTDILSYDSISIDDVCERLRVLL
jgi:serine/threonine protein kinase